MATVAPSMVARLLAFTRMGTNAGGEQVTAFLTTMTAAAGSPSTRQVSTWIDDDFTVGSITGPNSLKSRHVRRNPRAAFLWVELAPRKPARMVTIEGITDVVEEADAVGAFLERRAAFHGVPVHEASRARHLIRLRPTLLRAERFLDEGTAALVIRDFDSFSFEQPGG